MGIQPEGRSIERALVVAIHDVAPPFEPEIRAQLQMLAAIGVRRRVLKVVPNWHGVHPLPMAPAFVDLLRSELAAGSELVLHGLEHWRKGPMQGPWLDRLRATLFAGDVAEFMTLSAVKAGQAVREGLDLLARADLPQPTAFCAPGWLLNEEGERAIREAGIRRLIGMFSVRDLWSSRRYRMPAFGYMGASPGHEAVVGLLNWLVRNSTLSRRNVAKVYLHPQGDLNGLPARRVLDRIAEMVRKEGWQPITYAELYGDVGRAIGQGGE